MIEEITYLDAYTEYQYAILNKLNEIIDKVNGLDADIELLEDKINIMERATENDN